MPSQRYHRLKKRGLDSASGYAGPQAQDSGEGEEILEHGPEPASDSSNGEARRRSENAFELWSGGGKSFRLFDKNWVRRPETRTYHPEAKRRKELE
jgi:hypothetical protein